MITKDTARQIYNCYAQIETIDQLKKDMADEVTKAREREAEYTKKHPFEEPLPEKGFGKYDKGMQLGVPDGITMRIFNISPELAVKVMDEHRKTLEKKMETLEAIAKVEMTRPLELCGMT